MSQWKSTPNSLFLSGLLGMLIYEIKEATKTHIKSSKEKQDNRSTSPMERSNAVYILTQLVVGMTNDLVVIEKVSSTDIILEYF